MTSPVTTTVRVRPRDLQVGDLIPTLREDLSLVDLPVESVKKVHVRGVTAYRVTVDGKTSTYPSSAVVTVRR